MNNHSVTLVINSRKQSLAPTLRTDFIRKKLKKGLAKILFRFRRNIRVVMLLEKKYLNRKTEGHFGIGIDPGYDKIGFALYRKYSNYIRFYLIGHYNIHAQDIRKHMDERRMYRRLRRYYRRKNVIRKCGKAKYRKARFLNRKSNSLNPTMEYLLRVHTNLVRWFSKYFPIKYISLEYAKFDIQKMKNHYIKSWQYNKGETYGYEHVKAYVLARDKYQCQICKAKNIELHVHHIVHRSEGGTDRPDNLITLCKRCHNKIHKGKIDRNSIPKPTNSYRPSGVLNSVMPFILENYKLMKYDVSLTTGADTKGLRLEKELQKRHSVDAMMIVLNTIDKDMSFELMYNSDIELIQFRRHHDRAKCIRLEDRKYIDPNTKEIVAWNRNKRTEQIKDSFKEYIEKNPNKYNLIVKPGKRVYRSDWTKVYRGKFKDIPSNLIGKGAVVIYKDDNDRVKKGVASAFSSSEYKIYLYPKGYINIRNFIGIVRRGGIIPVF